MKRYRRYLNSFLFHCFSCILGFLMLYPILWMISSSFKESSQVFLQAHSLIPRQLKLSNYVQGWSGFSGTTFATFFKNSFFISITATVGVVFSSAIIAYGFARIRFRGKRIWFTCMLLTMMLPFQVIMVPQYILFHQLDWMNSFKPIIVPQFFGYPFFIFLMMQFIQGMPYELDEAAIIDGCNRFSIFYRIILPLIKPALITSAIFSFYWRWEDFLAPLLYLNKIKMYPVSLALKLFSDPSTLTDWGAMFAMATLSLVPVFLIFFTLQRYIVDGISTTGLKG